MDQPRALALHVERSPAQVTVTVVGHSARPTPVRYTLDVTGASTTRHAGRSTVGPGTRTLSTVRFPDRAPWRVRLAVDEDARAYAIERASDDPRPQ